jgi:hypothetical protein
MTSTKAWTLRDIQAIAVLPIEGLLQVQLTPWGRSPVVTDHAASSSSLAVKASSNSTGVSLPSPR